MAIYANTHSPSNCKSCPPHYLQNVADFVLLSIICGLFFGILVALQFPTVLSSPVAALGFAIITIASLSAAAITLVGEQIAPLPLFALILVNALSIPEQLPILK